MFQPVSERCAVRLVLRYVADFHLPVCAPVREAGPARSLASAKAASARHYLRPGRGVDIDTSRRPRRTGRRRLMS